MQNTYKKQWATVMTSCALAITSNSNAAIVYFEESTELTSGGTQSIVTATFTGKLKYVVPNPIWGHSGQDATTVGVGFGGSDSLYGSGSVTGANSYGQFRLAGTATGTTLGYGFDPTKNRTSIGPGQFGFQGHFLYLPTDASKGNDYDSGTFDFDLDTFEIVFHGYTLDDLGAASFNNTLAFTTQSLFVDRDTPRTNIDTISYTTVIVPEPSSSILFSLGALGLIARRRR